MQADIKTDNGESRDIRTLSYAEHFLIWAVRTSVACSVQCRTLHREFSHAFGGQESEGILAFHSIVSLLAKGRRKLRLGRPGHIETTRDEIALLALFAAAQKGLKRGMKTVFWPMPAGSWARSRLKRFIWRCWSWCSYLRRGATGCAISVCRLSPDRSRLPKPCAGCTKDAGSGLKASLQSGAGGRGSSCPEAMSTDHRV